MSFFSSLKVVPIIFIFGFSKLAIALDAPAAMVPAGLTPGETFYIVFVTSTTINAVDGNTATYDIHVNTAADLSGVKGTNDASITWKAMVATLNDGAQATSLFAADTSRPIYNLNGNKVADSSADMFDGTLDNAVTYSEAGTNVCTCGNEVWSGMDNSGAAFDTRELGEANVLSGRCDSAISAWNFAATRSNTDLYKVYALSPLLTVSGAVSSNIGF